MTEATQTLATLITSRRTVRQTQNTPIPLETINKILEQAAYAPFHSEVEPWAVKIASTEQEKKYFFQCVFKSYERIGLFESYTDEKIEKVRESYREYFEGTPISILIATDVFDHEKRILNQSGLLVHLSKTFNCYVGNRILGLCGGPILIFLIQNL
ncbi:nitroreductase family protein [Brevibacillus laterosporus]